MFSLDSFTKATLTSFNPRAELHGEDKESAADLSFTLNQSNAILTEFGSQLRSSLYWNSGEPAQQGELIAPISDLPNLRNSMLVGPIKLNTELVGWCLVVDYGTGGPKSIITINGCTVKKFVADCKEGGSVALSFQVQGKPSEKDAGKIYTLIGRELDIKLLAPEAEEELEAA